MTHKLYIGNLPFNITSSTIRDLFDQAGLVNDVYISRNPYTEKSSGFGFVEMVSDSAARKAIELFHGYALSDRPMTVQMIDNPTPAGWKGSAGSTVVYRKPRRPAEEG